MAAESIQRSPLEKLPFEVLEMICAFLSRADLKALRLVSCAFDGPSLSTLFRTVYLRVHLGSFEKLQDISRSEKLSKHVRHISYDGRIERLYRASPNLAHWIEYYACYGLVHPRDKAKKREFLQQFTQQELHEFYQNFNQFLSDQRHMLKGDDKNRMLRDALQNLPRLSDVEFVMPGPPDPYEPAPDLAWNSLSPVAQKILAQPCRGVESDRAGHFWALLQSAYLAGHAERLTHVHGESLDLKYWPYAAASIDNCHGSFSSLQHISLSFDYSAYHYDGKATRIAAIIARAPSLRSLFLSFGYFSLADSEVIMPLSQIIPPNTRLHHLRSLSLHGLVTSEAHMCGVLRRHRGTLRSLELANMRFDLGSWILFIGFLNEEMTLDHVKFDGHFSNSDDESWVARDEAHGTWPALAGASAQGSRKYLIYRIERFITGRSNYPNPFTPTPLEKRDDDEDGHHYILPWGFEQDRSWYFSDTL